MTGTAARAEFVVDVAPNFPRQSLDVWVTQPQHERVYRYSDEPGGRWEPYPPPGIVVDPSFSVSDDAAKALLDALLDHYRGGSDARLARADFENERARADKLIDAVVAIARGRNEA